MTGTERPPILFLQVASCYLPTVAGWLAVWLAGWLAGWLVGWLTGWLAVWLAGWLGGWVAGWLGGWPREMPVPPDRSRGASAPELAEIRVSGSHSEFAAIQKTR